MATKYLDYQGLQKYNQKVKDTFVEEEDLKINQIKRNGLTVQPVNKSVDISVPIRTSELTNDSNFVTDEEVNQKIAGLKSMTIKVVDFLPSTGENDVMYLVPNGESGNNVKDEYLYVDGKFEKVGDTSTATEVESISDDEIDALFN